MIKLTLSNVIQLSVHLKTGQRQTEPALKSCSDHIAHHPILVSRTGISLSSKTIVCCEHCLALALIFDSAKAFPSAISKFGFEILALPFQTNEAE